MAINFNAQFIVNEKTATRVLRLTDTSTGFTLAKGNFSVTFPDGSQILHTDFISPDISAPGGSTDIALITDIDNTVLTGTYVIDFVTLDAGLTERVLQQTFDFNWEKPVKIILNQSDVVIPTITFRDSTAYETSGNFTGTLTRNFYTTTPSTSEVGVITKTSVGDVLTPSNASKYYEGIYLVKSDISVAYTHSSLSWLTVLYVDLLEETYDIREAPTQNELVALMNEYKDQIEEYKTTNPAQYELLNEEYDLVIALYSHIVARFDSGTLAGCKPILDQLLGLLPPTEPYTYKATQMLPFTLTAHDSVSWGSIIGTLSSQTDLQAALNNRVPYTGATGDVNLGVNNLSANNFFGGFGSVTASGTQIVLTIGSVPSYIVNGSGGQTFKLPSATTLPNGANFYFNNNQSSGAITVNNNSNTLIVSIPSGGYAQVTLLDNSTAAGSWDRHFEAPANVSWSTNTFDYAGSITSATWNGNVIQPNRGGTGQSTYTNGQLLIGNTTGNTLTKATLTPGTGISITNGAGSITIASSVVNPITGTGTVNYVPKFDTTSSIANSTIQDSGSLITLGSNVYATGAMGIGTSLLTGYGLRLNVNITGSISSVGFYNTGVIQSDVTSSTYYNRTVSATAAASFAITNIYHYGATQGTFGAGSTVTNQFGFLVASSLTGATNNYAFAGQLAAATGIWNLYNSGTANNYVAGAFGIGRTSLSNMNLGIDRTMTGVTIFYSLFNTSTVAADVTSTATYFQTAATTAASAFTLANLYHYAASQSALGAGSTVTSQTGYYVSSNLIGAGTNYAFRGLIPSGTGRWNLYMDGTAENYLAGALGIGSTSLVGINLRIDKNIVGGALSTPAFAISVHNANTIQSDVTSNYWGFNSQPTTVASLALGTVIHYQARSITLGSGSSVTNQYGFLATNTLTQATNNYGFFGSIASAANAWNIYMSGTANNYLAGSLGIGSTNLTGYNLRVAKTITGAVASYGIVTDGAVQSDVTTTAFYNNVISQTAAASFTLPDLICYNAAQGTFGAGSTVTNQYGFSVSANLIGATNNFAYRGLIPSGTNNWNLYMNGTANNYMAGALAIGGNTTLTGLSLLVQKNITGSVNPSGIKNTGTVQSDVTGIVRNFDSVMSIQATTFTLSEFRHYATFDNSISGGAVVTTQTGFYASSNFASATNNYGFRGQVVAAANNWNIYMDGTAPNYIQGSLGIGTTNLTGYGLRVSKNITGATSAYGIFQNGTVQSDVTTLAIGIWNTLNTVASAFTLPAYTHINISQGTIGAGSSVTNQYGLFIDSSLTGATNNYGFYGNIVSGTGRWNLYMNGTANNYLAGRLGIGTTAPTSTNVVVSLNITGAVASNGVYQLGIVQSDVTTSAYGFRNLLNTAAATFTLATYNHYAAQGGGTIGAGSTVTNQNGFSVESNMVGATNNYGFWGNLAAASNVWNLYMNGTASNYLNGSLGVGATVVNASAKVQIDSTTQGFLPPRMTATQRTAISSPATGLIVYQTDGVEGLWLNTSAGWKELTVV